MRHLTLDVVKRRLAERSPVREPGSAVAQAAVAAILGPGLELLVIRRAERAGDPWSGQMALPGGRRDAADADLLATAIRETAEETGIALAGSQLVGELDDVHPRTPALPPIVIRPFVFGIDRLPEVQASTEVAGHFWVPLAELAGRLVEEEILIRGATRTVRGYRLGAGFVWGLTERILTPFLEMLE